MYAQMVYKDRKIMEMNAKILEQDKRIMDLQEFAGEKDQVINGRTKVVEVCLDLISKQLSCFALHSSLTKAREKSSRRLHTFFFLSQRYHDISHQMVCNEKV